MIQWLQGVSQAFVALGLMAVFAYWLRDRLLAPFLESYAKKTAEVLATRHNLSEVLRQLKETTQLVQAIQSTFQRELWEHQTGWKERRDVYVSTLVAFVKCSRGLREYAYSIGEDDQKAFAEAEVKVSEANAALYQSLALLHLTAPQEITQLLENALNSWPSTEVPKQLMEFARTLSTTSEEFAAKCKSDLYPDRESAKALKIHANN